MISHRWFASGSLCLAFFAAVGCGSDSSSNGGSGGALSSGGAGGGGISSDALGAGGGGGSSGGGDAALVADSQFQPVDAPVPSLDVALDAPVVNPFDGGVTMVQIKSLLASRCVSCHSGTGSSASRLDFSDRPDASSSLYARLTGPLALETYCGENLDAGSDSVVAHRAVVPGDPASSFLYLKILGEQPSPGAPPANCGVRMPRVLVLGVDGGASSTPACDSLDGGASANCLGAVDVDLVHQWILQGAPQ